MFLWVEWTILLVRAEWSRMATLTGLGLAQCLDGVTRRLGHASLITQPGLAPTRFHGLR